MTELKGKNVFNLKEFCKLIPNLDPNNLPVKIERIHKYPAWSAPIFYRLHFEDGSVLDYDPLEEK